MATRFELLRKSPNPIAKGFIDAVFLRNRNLTWESDDVMSDPYKRSDLVYICISTTARAISQIPIEVGQESGEDEYKPLPKSDPWQQLFERPNYLLDRYSFVEAMIGYLLLDGDSFIIPFPPGSSKPSSLWIVSKKFIGPIIDHQPSKDNRKPTNQLVGWNYNPNGVTYDAWGGTLLNNGSILLEVDEVCHEFFWNPDSPFMGQAPHEAGKMNILVDFKASRYTGNFFDEGAVPGGMLYTDKTLTDKQFQRVLGQFESKHGTYRHSHRVAVLENGLKYTQAGLSQKDMEFPKLRDLTARRVFQTYGMKEAVISETADVNYATSREQRKEWWESTNLPLMRMCSSALNFTLFPTKSRLRCAFNINKIEALRESLKDKTDTGYRLWQMGATFNEINQRMELGFRKQPWGDVWYMPVNLVPVTDSTGEAPIQSDSYPLIGAKNRSMLSYIKDERELRKEGLWNSFVKRTAPYEETFTKKVSRVFYDMRKRTLELLYHEQGKWIKNNYDLISRLIEQNQPIYEIVKTLDEVDNELYIDEAKTLEKVTSPIYIVSLELGVQLVVEETGSEIAFSLSDPEAINFLMGKKLKIVGINQTVKNQIHKQLVEAYQAGESVDQVADRIRNVFDIAKSRARAIARTEVGGASNEGRFLAMNRSGFREQEWFTALDERVRITHKAMHGKIIKMGEMWVLPSGVSLRHPGDHNGPAMEIINCRCISVVVPGSHYTED